MVDNATVLSSGNKIQTCMVRIKCDGNKQKS
jgi:hypothetical protein